MEKSNERESSLRKELADDRLTLERIDEMQLAGDPIPANSTYESYDEWMTNIEKEISRERLLLIILRIKKLKWKLYNFISTM